jgi:hypothetical protein
VQPFWIFATATSGQELASLQNVYYVRILFSGIFS